jgi:hypothetical protein
MAAGVEAYADPIRLLPEVKKEIDTEKEPDSAPVGTLM